VTQQGAVIESVTFQVVQGTDEEEFLSALRQSSEFQASA
jgi:hypothetical protein